MTLSYQRRIALIALLLTSLVGASTYRADSDGTWILGTVALGVFVHFALVLLGLLLTEIGYFGLAPQYEPGVYSPRYTYFAAVFGIALTIFLVEFLLLVTAHLLLGASKRELAEHLETLSLPLGWWSTKFLIRPNKSFLDVCGIILGNSFFIGAIYLICAKVVRTAMARSRPTQINIDGGTPPDDD